jgi:hypothetical protein
MTIIESGIIAGIPMGAIIGGVICKSYGIPGVIGGSLAGMILGAAIGWLYAYLIMFQLSVVGVLWRSARKHVDTVPASARHPYGLDLSVIGEPGRGERYPGSGKCRAHQFVATRLAFFFFLSDGFSVGFQLGFRTCCLVMTPSICATKSG